MVTNGATTFCGTVQVNAVAPSIFTLDQSGTGLPAAQVVITHADGSQTFMPVAQYSNTPAWNGVAFSNWVATPINLGSSSDIAVLELFGTGIRNASSYIGLNGFKTINDVVTVGHGWTLLYAGAQGGREGAGENGSFYGLDQVNVVLPRSLAGSGTISFSVNTAGYCDSCRPAIWQVVSSNVVQIEIQ